MRDSLKKEQRTMILFHSFPHKEILHKLSIWLIATQRNPTPSVLLPALWSQKQAKQSHCSLQPLNKLGLSWGMGTKNFFVLSRSWETLSTSFTPSSHFTDLNLFWWQLWCPNEILFQKIYILKHIPSTHPSLWTIRFSVSEISIVDYYQTGPQLSKMSYPAHSCPCVRYVCRYEPGKVFSK